MNTPSPNAAPSDTSSLTGLTQAEAARRLAQDGANLLPGSAPKSLFAMVYGVLTEPMFLMLLVAGGIYLVLGDRAEALFLLAFVAVGRIGQALVSSALACSKPRAR